MSAFWLLSLGTGTGFVTNYNTDGFSDPSCSLHHSHTLLKQIRRLAAGEKYMCNSKVLRPVTVGDENKREHRDLVKKKNANDIR